MIAHHSSIICLILLILSKVTDAAAGRSYVRSIVGRREPSSAGKARNRRLTVPCPDPDSVRFEAQIHLTTYYPTECDAAEIAYIGERIHHHWGGYSAYTASAGPVAIESKGDICAASNRRHLLTAAEEELARQKQKQFSINFLYKFNGACSYCDKDNLDGGRRLSVTSPVTLVFDIDDSPQDMWFQIKDDSGLVLFDQQSLTNAVPGSSNYTQTFNLIPGKTYTVVLGDRYGNGWDYGGVNIFDGIPATGMDLLTYISGDFNSQKTDTFTVPLYGVNYRSANFTNPADILFPELEAGLSKWITFYIQQEFHNDNVSCLYLKAPQVWVDLIQTTVDDIAEC